MLFYLASSCWQSNLIHSSLIPNSKNKRNKKKSTMKTFFIFSQKNFIADILENLVPNWKTSGENFPSLKNKTKPTLIKFIIFREMKLSSCKHKKLWYFFKKGVSLYFRKWKFLAAKLKDFLYFSQIILYLIFFIRIFSIRIINRNYYDISNKLRRLFFLSNIFTFF